MTPAALLSAHAPAIVTAARRLATQGLVPGTAGNVSVRDGDLVAVTATGARFADLTAEHVTVVDLAGRVVGGDLEPTSEIELHLGIYADLASSAIVHTHAPAATAVGLLVDEMPCVHYQMLLLGGSVRVAPYATFGSAALADNVRTALTGRSAALMANHGAVTHAASLASAVELTELLEWACAVYCAAAAAGPSGPSTTRPSGPSSRPPSIAATEPSRRPPGRRP